jgi:hypothetical protein
LPALVFDLQVIFQKAPLIGRPELARVLDLIERNQGGKTLFQQDLVKALRVVEPIYKKTKDPKLQELLTRAETNIR